jgi:hypothetical protein
VTVSRRTAGTTILVALLFLASSASGCGGGVAAVTPSPHPTATWTRLWTQRGTLHPDARGWTKGSPFHLRYGLVRFRVALTSDSHSSGLTLVPLAPSAARAQGLRERAEGGPTTNGKGTVTDVFITGPVVAGTYRVDLAGRGAYELAAYTRQP